MELNEFVKSTKMYIRKINVYCMKAYLNCKEIRELGMVVYTCNPMTREAEIGTLRVPDQPGLHSKTVSKRKKKEETR
jgi:hypothetical protein